MSAKTFVSAFQNCPTLPVKECYTTLTVQHFTITYYLTILGLTFFG